MKKFLAGCLIAAVVLGILAGVAVNYAWRFASPVIESVTRRGFAARRSAGSRPRRASRPGR